MAVRKVGQVQPAADGTPVGELVAIVNTVSTKLTALLQKLDADTGITDTDYEATVVTTDTIAYRGGGTPT
jgi:hypothetical protein